jgi:hypothetical protein
LRGARMHRRNCEQKSCIASLKLAEYIGTTNVIC